MPMNGKMESLKKGAWSPEEDQKLSAYIRRYGIWNWSLMPKAAGLSRSGKSCRLRWMNYLRPSLRRECYSSEEIGMIIKLHKSLGNKWSKIAEKLPGRTDNGIKNFWNTHIKNRCSSKKIGDGDTLKSMLPGFSAPQSFSSSEESYTCTQGNDIMEINLSNIPEIHVEFEEDLLLIEPFVIEDANSRKMDNSPPKFEEHVDWGLMEHQMLNVPDYRCDCFNDLDRFLLNVVEDCLW